MLRPSGAASRGGLRPAGAAVLAIALLSGAWWLLGSSATTTNVPPPPQVVSDVREEKALAQAQPNNPAKSTQTAPRSAPPSAPAAPAPTLLSPTELAARIDAHFRKFWTDEKVRPASRSGDEEFLRRLSLDIGGKIPSAAEVRSFVADGAAAKRQAVVHRSLDHARFANHLAVTLREMLLPGASTDPQKLFLVPPFEAWLRLRLADGVTYDRLVEELLTTPVAMDQAIGMRAARGPGPEAFTLVHEGKPEELAGSAARALLGVQVQCAQCHNHPFADWKQDQFWSFATFFTAGATRAVVAASMAPVLELEVPGKNRKVGPAFLDGRKPDLSSGDSDSRRAALVRWMTAADNPYFARAAANRVWAHFLGRGIIHPVDDLGGNNPASHPEVLELLAEQFRLHGFDLRYLAEAVANTEVYQLSSIPSDASQDEPANFARMPVRSMTPEQLYDSLNRAAGGESASAAASPNDPAVLFGDNARTRFLRQFTEPGERTTPKGSLLQALTLMNGGMLSEAVDPAKGKMLRAVIESPFLDDAGRVEALFLQTLSRRPSADESKAMQAKLARAGDAAAKRKTMANLFWALLNSTEFALVP